MLYCDLTQTDINQRSIMQFKIARDKSKKYMYVPLGSIDKLLINIFEMVYDVLRTMGAYYLTHKDYARKLIKELYVTKEVKKQDYKQL